MLTSLSFIFLGGLAAAALCRKLNLPGLIGMLFTGIVLGPYVLNLFDAKILNISGDLRQLALLIILLKAGFSLNSADLKKVGLPAILLSFVPASCEIAAYTLFAPLLLHINIQEAALMGSVLGAVSPAVVVPRMVQYMEKGLGTNKGIPAMIIAGSSCDDIFVIVLFSCFLSMLQGQSSDFSKLLNVPLAIVLGIIAGIICAYLLHAVFQYLKRRQRSLRNSLKLIIILGLSLLLLAVEKELQGIIAFSGLLAVISMAVTLKQRTQAQLSADLAAKLGKLWLAAELILFVLVGAAVDIKYTLNAGLAAVLLIFLTLIIRTVGVFICLWPSKLLLREKFFCALAYLPKATVQAAIGSVPAACGLACGPIILSVAVLAILITAPLGAFCMDYFSPRLLTLSDGGTQE